jgi:hypothetical protein
MKFTFLIAGIVAGQLPAPIPVETERECVEVARLTQLQFNMRAQDALVVCFRFGEEDGIKRGWYFNRHGKWIEVQIPMTEYEQ